MRLKRKANLGVIFLSTILFIVVTFFVVEKFSWPQIIFFIPILLGILLIRFFQKNNQAPIELEVAKKFDEWFQTGDRALSFEDLRGNTENMHREDILALLKRQLEHVVPEFDARKYISLVPEKINIFFLLLSLLCVFSFFVFPKEKIELSSSQLRDIVLPLEELLENPELPEPLHKKLTELKESLQGQQKINEKILSLVEESEELIEQLEAEKLEGSELIEESLHEEELQKELEKEEQQQQEKDQKEKEQQEQKEHQQQKQSEDQNKEGSGGTEKETEGNSSQEGAGEKGEGEGSGSEKGGSEGETAEQQGNEQQDGSKGQGSEGSQQGKTQDQQSSSEQSPSGEGKESSSETEAGEGEGDSEGGESGTDESDAGDQGEEQSSSSGGEAGSGSDSGQSEQQSEAFERAKDALNKIKEAGSAQQNSAEGNQDSEKQSQDGKKQDSSAASESDQQQGQSGNAQGQAEQNSGEKEGSESEDKSEEGSGPPAEPENSGKQPEGNTGSQSSPDGQADSTEFEKTDQEKGNLPSVSGEDAKAKRYEEGEGGGDGLGGNRGYEEQEIANPDENVDARFTEKKGERVFNPNDAEYQTSLEEVKAAKPEPIKSNRQQRIPLEYQDILGE